MFSVSRMSHTLTVLSELPVTTSSGSVMFPLSPALMATHVTLAEWPDHEYMTRTS